MNAHLGGGGSGMLDDQEQFLAPLRGETNVALNAIVERFTQRSPVTVEQLSAALLDRERNSPEQKKGQ